MDEQRRKIIVNEINNWRKNQLLPEHYCIFLLNLYTEGELPPDPGKASPAKSGAALYRDGAQTARNRSSAAGRISAGVQGGYEPGIGTGAAGGGYGYQNGADTVAVSWKMILAWFAAASVIAVMILLAFHFNGFTTPMQIAILSIAILIFYILSVMARRRVTAVAHLTLGISFLLLIVAGVYFLGKWNLPFSATLLFLAVVCFLWLLNGLWFRYGYLLYCGLIGLGVIYGVVTVLLLGEAYSWWIVQLYWVPLALLMVGSGFLLHERQPLLSGALAICGLLYFFGAEISSLYIDALQHDVIQLLLFIKVLVSSAFFFVTRRYWFHWLGL
ncbi:MAG: hypothetical protein H0Z34_10280 [Brevibacillus sp.]|nr:hypothetical protein [Brevibacillus sp.]